jgi:hypothetical protein
MISDLDETIRQLLIQEGGLDPAEIDISFEIPNREWSAGISRPTVNCYLFDIRENRELRQRGVLMDRNGSNGNARRRPPMCVDLTYLITAWTRVVEDEHRLLWHALQTLMRFGTLPEALLHGALPEHAMPLYARIAQPDGVLKSPGEFWTALENQLKPSLSYVVTLALDYDQLQVGPPVLTTTTRLRALDAPGDAAVRIGGVLHAADGAPLPDTELWVEGIGTSVMTAADGRFRLNVPRPGVYALVIRSGADLHRREIRVPAGSYDLRLDETPDPPAARSKRRRSGPKGGDRRD